MVFNFTIARKPNFIAKTIKFIKGGKLMGKRISIILCVIMAVFVIHGISEAAHFDGVGSHIESAETSTLYLGNSGGICANTDVGAGNKITIMPDPGENIGDPTTVSYCWSTSGVTHVTSAGYGAFGGIGATVVANSDCTSTASVTPSGAATFNLIHNNISTPHISFPATTISGNQTVNQPLTCGSFNAQIGDQVQGIGGVGGAVYGPTSDPTTYATFTFFLSIDLPGSPHAVPTMTEWGMIIFMILAGLGAMYYLRKQKTAKS